MTAVESGAPIGSIGQS